MSTKTCRTCSIEKSCDEFGRTNTKSANPGYRNECKGCRSASHKKSCEASNATLAVPAAPPSSHVCIKCNKGPNDVRFKWRSDVVGGGWRSECNTCYNEKGYSITYRSRERSKDEDAYLKRNAERHLAWARINPEKVARQQELGERLPERKIKQIESTAKARGIEFVGADRDAMGAKLSDPCFYCFYVSSDNDKLNGLDRVHSALPYSDSNTVPCCGCCNGMKSVMDINEFVHMVRRICSHQGIQSREGGNMAEQHGAGRERPTCLAGTKEACAKTKDKRMELDEDKQLALKCSPCYMCGVAFSCGIDRVDSDGDYTIDNTRPCCAPCNYLKKHLTLDQFKKHLTYVLTHTANWVLQDASMLSTCLTNRRIRIPVAMATLQGDIIFPSSSCAADLVKCSKQAVIKAINTNGTCRGFKWRSETVSAYHNQRIDAATVIPILKALRCRGKP